MLYSVLGVYMFRRMSSLFGATDRIADRDLCIYVYAMGVDVG